MPVRFKGIQTTRNRGYNEKDIARINEELQKFLPMEERAAILGSIIEESGGNPFAKNDSGTYQGLLQWGADRYIPKSSDRDTEMNNQIQYILSTIDNTKDKVSWTHGGKGSNYSSGIEAYKTFSSKKAPFKDKFRAFSYGYVRPAGKEDSFNNRLNVAKKVLNNLVIDEVLSKPKPEKWTPMKFEMKQIPLKYSEGGDLNTNCWDALSMKDKAEMMKVAIANGITTLPEIRKAYNEFAEGGRMSWTMQDEAGYRYWKSRLPKNLRDTNDNDYDMRAAYKAGMEPEWDEKTKTYHLGSRDPQSGRILKSPHHSTFLKALIEDATMGYYPTMDNKGNTYTETWKGNTYANGGYMPSDSIKKRIANWEGASMKTNRSFEAEARDFNRVIPTEVRNKLSPLQLDALYSYGYNVGMGNLKKRVLPALTAYTQGKATEEDVQRSMWAAKDSQLRGLTTRRNAEREMFGGNYRTTFDNKNLGVHIDPSSLGLSQTFFDTLNIQLPQMQMASNMDVDPSTLYKAPMIDETLFANPKQETAKHTYSPEQEKLEGLRNFNTVMGLMGESTPLGVVGDNSPGLLSYINAIYGSD